MAGYKELREGYSFTLSSSGQNGTRIFIDDSAGSDTLPELDDPWSVDYTNCVCTSIQEELYHFESGDCKKKYTCNYTFATGGTSAQVPISDEDNLICSGATEIVAVDANNNWVWHVDETVAGTIGVQQKVYKNTIRGSMSKTITKGTSSYVAYKASIMTKLGKINSVALTEDDWYYEWPIGSVLFTSTDERLVYDTTGTKEWQITLNFAYRLIYKAAAPDTPVNYAWNYIINNKRTGADDYWQMPARSDGVPNVAQDLLYGITDLNGLW